MFLSRKPTAEHEGPINAGRDVWEVVAEAAKKRPLKMTEYAQNRGMKPSRFARFLGKRVVEVDELAPTAQRIKVLPIPDNQRSVAPNAGRKAEDVAAEARQALTTKRWEEYRTAARDTVQKSELTGKGTLSKGNHFSPLTSESDFASPASQDVAPTSRRRVRRLRTVKARSK